MEEKKYKHSFARRMTRRVMLVLLVMMSALGFLIYYITKELVVEISGSTVHNTIQTTGEIICSQMLEVSVAVENNIFDIERNLGQPNEMQRITERIVKLNPRIRSCGISFIENYYPNKGHAFCPYTWKDDSLQVNTQKGTPLGDYLESEWFKEAVAKDSAYWSKPFFDAHEKERPFVAYLQPIHDRQGRVVAILGADLSLEFMTDLLVKQDSATTAEGWIAVAQSYLLQHDGTYITHPEKKRILKANYFRHFQDADEPGIAKKLIADMKKGVKSEDEIEKAVIIDRDNCYVFYSPIKNTDWVLATEMPSIALEMFGIIGGLLALLIIVFILMVTFLVCQLAISQVSKPLKHLSATADEIANGKFNTVLPVIDSHDEIHKLRDSFENMQLSLTDYIEKLKSTTAAKASIESELKIAHDIQMSMLPKTYPAFPERHDVDIYGQVTPAKAVGGDLYDFYIRDNKLIFCIGDVSGKGVPASLVMAVTRSLFRNISAYTQAPDRIVVAVNDALSDNNESSMFVTFFVGVLDLASGHLDYANAAHNPPLVLRGSEVSTLPCESNIPVGVMPEWSYTVETLQMEPGDSLFLYTDGLNEAEDIEHQQFGMERVEQVAKTTANTPQTLIEAMTSSVEQFVGNAEQSDDLTMLAIHYTLNTHPSNLNPQTSNLNNNE
jgi:sigma-B regulation protein RsbU (phosphoserine phosphatase)